ncbi:MAG: VWA domain-containing protein [Zoogloeaceae bacterium]|nr:VWA domain-containing protein [Rhodocyclaceae bacterium]MCP5233133.1 VWA domain-containing protein [Zoogloeaceae bacterium]MCP5238440.1 VWA domain-containing protein [Zoogloeaceae bacterium]MCP5254647.1 VWA domain-containing protein [Zoogloeaceae bacterium]MCP5295106.1 VWA domain-containing protein [Zoogloeaceae bacterium]
MLIDFFLHLREHKLPVSTKEFLTLLEGLQARVCGHSIDDFYVFSRACLVKDETLYDRFDQAFGSYFKGVTEIPGLELELPEEWLRAMMKRHLTPEQKAALEKLGWDKLMEEFQKRLEEQKGRHEGGSKWIGSGGSSPFGNSGYHPEGIRVGGPSAGNRTAVKVWEQREYRNLDDTVELGTRNIKVALRRLRRFARSGAAEELDLDGTIAATARNAGWLDLLMRPERHNSVKVLMFFDVGGSMDDHIKVCEELFSACRSEFKHLEYYYFHNCVYDWVWKDSHLRHKERISTLDVIHRYGGDYKLIFVGDATMSPYEIIHQRGAIDYANEEPGAVWLRRLLDAYPAAAWLNPEPERLWEYRHSIRIVRDLAGERMYPLTIDGLGRAIRQLSRSQRGS